MRRLTRHGGNALAISIRSRSRPYFAASIVVATGLAFSYGLLMIDFATADDLWVIAAGALLGILGGDFLSGLVHWSCDTWGSRETPVLGPSLIQAFRDHHVDPGSIVEHDWIEVNGEAALAVSAGFIACAPLAWILASGGHAFAYATLLTLLCGTAFANQLHKWAHCSRPPSTVRWLQRVGILLSPERHARHHAAPHTSDYCISTGWLNALLNATGFWRKLEKLVHSITGAEARRCEERS